MTTAKQARNARFQRGSAMYSCRCCDRQTRSTGNGDNEHVRLCAECYDLAGEENHLSDNGTLYASPAEVRRLFTVLKEKGVADPESLFRPVADYLATLEAK